MERKKVGEVFHYYGHISVAAIRLTDGSIAVGDTVQIQGPTTNLEQNVGSLQIEHAEVSRADVGQEVGMKVQEHVREKDFVYKLIPTEERAAREAPTKPTPAARPRAKAKPKRKAAPKPKAKPKKKAKLKRKAPVRKASRSTRRRAPRGSRKSRRR